MSSNDQPGANAYQVGGVHYKSKFQHWDFVAVAGLDYFQGVITKYITRWRKKNGLEDLMKAEHYLLKYKELVRGGNLIGNGHTAASGAGAYADEFSAANELTEAEAYVVRHVSIARGVSDLTAAHDMLKRMIADAGRQGGAA